MIDETKPEQTKPSIALVTEGDTPPSSILYVSVRGWAALLLVGTVCAMQFMGMEVSEPLNNMSMVAIGFLFARVGTTK
jgi:hypothetical protein